MTKVVQKWYYFSLLRKTLSLKQKLLRLLFANLWKNWATLFSNIWSHWSLVTKISPDPVLRL